MPLEKIIEWAVVCQVVYLIWRDDAAAVAQGARVNAQVGASRNGLAHVGGAAAGSDNDGDHGVLPYQVRAQERASGHLID